MVSHRFDGYFLRFSVAFLVFHGYFLGFSMAFSWLFVGLLWYFLGFFQLSCGIFVGCAWVFYGYVLRFSFFSHSLVIDIFTAVSWFFLEVFPKVLCSILMDFLGLLWVFSQFLWCFTGFGKVF